MDINIHSYQTSKSEKIKTIIFPILLIIIGIGSFVFGYFITHRSSDWISTSAKIVDITYDWSPSGSSNSKAYVDYLVNDINYSHIFLDAFESSFYVGMMIKIKYNPNNPAQISYDNPAYFSIIYIFAAILLLVGVLILIYTLLKYTKEKNNISN